MATTDGEDQVMLLFQRGYNKARGLYENDQLEDAMREAEGMLNDSAIPRYFRIKCYCLVAACCADEVEAEDLLERAESQWGLARIMIPTTGEHPITEEALTEMRNEIKVVRDFLNEERMGQAMEVDEDVDEDEGVHDEVAQAMPTLEFEPVGLQGKKVMIPTHGGDYGEQQSAGQLEQDYDGPGAAPLHHHRHGPGSMRLKKQKSRCVSLRTTGSDASFQPSIPLRPKNDDTVVKAESEVEAKDIEKQDTKSDDAAAVKKEEQ